MPCRVEIKTTDRDGNPTSEPLIAVTPSHKGRWVLMSVTSWQDVVDSVDEIRDAISEAKGKVESLKATSKLLAQRAGMLKLGLTPEQIDAVMSVKA